MTTAHGDLAPLDLVLDGVARANRLAQEALRCARSCDADRVPVLAAEAKANFATIKTLAARLP